MNIPSKKTFSISFLNGVYKLLRMQHGTEWAAETYPTSKYPDHDLSIHNSKYTFHEVWETSNFLELFLSEGCTYGEIAFRGDGEEQVKLAAEEMARMANKYGQPMYEDVFESNPAMYWPGFHPLRVMRQQNPALAHTMYNDWRGDWHYVLHADWIDSNEGRAFVVPARWITTPGGDRIRTLEDLTGLTIHIKNQAARLKEIKRVKRLFAHHLWAVRGEFRNEHTVPVHVPEGYPAQIGQHLTARQQAAGYRIGTEITADFGGGIEIEVLHVPLDQYMKIDEAGNKESTVEVSVGDGPWYIDVDFLHELGDLYDNDNLKAYKDGDAFLGTLLESTFFHKGIGHVCRMPGKYKIVAYGPKTELEFSHVFLGALINIKGGLARTDSQSMLSFLSLDDNSRRLWTDMAREHMDNINAALHDEEMMRHLVMTYIAPEAQTREDDLETWSLLDAVQNDVPILQNPGLLRRAERLLLNNMMNCERAQIPYPPDKACRVYVQPDPAMVNLATGHITPEKTSIRKKSVCVMEAPPSTMVALYRSPLGNNQEAVIAWNISLEERRAFKKFDGQGRGILGTDIKDQLDCAGGGDTDGDSFVCIWDPGWVKAFATVKPYPQAALPRAEEVALIENRFQAQAQRNDLPTPREWSLADCLEACEHAGPSGTTIGQIINAVTLDMLLSGDNKKQILGQMMADSELIRMRMNQAKQESDTARAKGDVITADQRLALAHTLKNSLDRLIRSYIWLRDREEYVLRQIACHVDAFIDGIKMGKSEEFELEGLNRLAQEVRQNSLVYPACWQWLAKSGMSRIPSNRPPDSYVLGISLFDETLGYRVKGVAVCGIMKDRDDLEKMFLQEEHLINRPIPDSLDRLRPRDPRIRDFVSGMRDNWRDFWVNKKPDADTRQIEAEGRSLQKIIVFGGDLPLTLGFSVPIAGIRTTFLSARVEGISPEVLQEYIAVELARQVYAYGRQIDPSQGFPDGLLWTDFMSAAYIRAMKKAKLTGQYVAVEFDTRAMHLRHKTVRTMIIEAGERARLLAAGKPITGRLLPERIEVKVKAGSVVRLSDGKPIGRLLTQEPVEDGEYIMEDGLVVIKRASLELTGKKGGAVDEAGRMILPGHEPEA